mmetsp:Transcript_7155/g.18321  ORF Transcript_7155/g.18321 Transcript_7155/m.18321 type:complete len:540 (+) Transcript_7155:65-1684(+)
MLLRPPVGGGCHAPAAAAPSATLLDGAALPCLRVLPQVFPPRDGAQEPLLLERGDGPRPHDARPGQHLHARDVLLPDDDAAGEDHAAAEAALAVHHDRPPVMAVCLVQVAAADHFRHVARARHAPELVDHGHVDLLDGVLAEGLGLVAAAVLDDARLVLEVHAHHRPHVPALAPADEVLRRLPVAARKPGHRARGAGLGRLELAHGVAAVQVGVRPLGFLERVLLGDDRYDRDDLREAHLGRRAGRGRVAVGIRRQRRRLRCRGGVVGGVGLRGRVHGRWDHLGRHSLQRGQRGHRPPRTAQRHRRRHEVEVGHLVFREQAQLGGSPVFEVLGLRAVEGRARRRVRVANGGGGVGGHDHRARHDPRRVVLQHGPAVLAAHEVHRDLVLQLLAARHPPFVARELEGGPDVLDLHDGAPAHLREWLSLRGLRASGVPRAWEADEALLRQRLAHRLEGPGLPEQQVRPEQHRLVGTLGDVAWRRRHDDRDLRASYLPREHVAELQRLVQAKRSEGLAPGSRAVVWHGVLPAPVQLVVGLREV